MQNWSSEVFITVCSRFWHIFNRILSAGTCQKCFLKSIHLWCWKPFWHCPVSDCIRNEWKGWYWCKELFHIDSFVSFCCVYQLYPFLNITTDFYRFLPNFTDLYWILPIFTVRFWLIVPNFTLFYLSQIVFEEDSSPATTSSPSSPSPSLPSPSSSPKSSFLVRYSIFYNY